LPERAMT